jgi:hypothetical protein
VSAGLATPGIGHSKFISFFCNNETVTFFLPSFATRLPLFCFLNPAGSHVYRNERILSLFDPGWGRTFYSAMLFYKHLTSLMSHRLFKFILNPLRGSQTYRFICLRFHRRLFKFKSFGLLVLSTLKGCDFNNRGCNPRKMNDIIRQP